MIGVINPAGIDTATEMSARLYLNNVVAGEADIAFGDFDQRLGQRLDHQVVDAELDVAALEARVELASGA